VDPRVGISAMARVLTVGLLVLIASAVDVDAIDAQWHAVYPSDPAQKTALHHCYAENPQFNRISAEARRGCYAKWLPDSSQAGSRVKPLRRRYTQRSPDPAALCRLDVAGSQLAAAALIRLRVERYTLALM